MPLTAFEQMSSTWGLSNDEKMCLIVKNNEEYGGIDPISWKSLGKGYLDD